MTHLILYSIVVCECGFNTVSHPTNRGRDRNAQYKIFCLQDFFEIEIVIWWTVAWC